MLRELFLYGVIGGAAAVLDYSVFLIFLHFGLAAELSSLLGQGAGFLLSFFGNTFLNFKKTDRLFMRFLLYLSVCLAGMALSTLLIFLLKNLMNLYALKLLCLILSAGLQFLLNKFITYR